MPYPTITIDRTAKLEKPMGLGEGRVTEGVMSDNWNTEREIRAGSLGLVAISRVILTPGTPLDITAYARVPNPGSVDNIAKVKSYLRQLGSTIRVGTPRTVTFPVSFTGSSAITLTAGSPIAARSVGSRYVAVRSKTRANFVSIGSPTYGDSSYIAVGPGSYPLAFAAFGR